MSTLNITLTLTLLSHLLVSFSLSPNLSYRPLPLDPGPFSSDLTFRCHSSLPLVLHTLSSYLCLHRSLRLLHMGRRRTAEDYQRTAEENGWVAGAHEEEDRKQQTKDEPSDRYKQNQQEALD
jgi:hypothetical protein